MSVGGASSGSQVAFSVVTQAIDAGGYVPVALSSEFGTSDISRPDEQRTSAKKLLERMKSAGRLDAFKAELANRKALDLLTESATPISVEQAQARDKLWTPGRDAEERSQQLWTPGS